MSPNFGGKMKVLLLVAHPALERSRMNRRLLDAVSALKGVTCHDLYEQYPDLGIDVKREQELLLAHDAVVFQSPFYWYSTPAILKEWQDLVLTHGWAYGAGGTALAGKVTFNALTTGGPAASYTPLGHNRFSVRALLAPYEATANLCGMRFLAPFVVHGVLRFRSDEDYEGPCHAYRRVIEALTQDRLDLDKAASSLQLDPEAGAIIRAPQEATEGRAF